MKRTSSRTRSKPRSLGSARAKRLPGPVVAAIDASRIVGIRAGARSDHRFIGIWAVVVDGRAYARSWTMKPDGWNRALLDDSRGAIQVGDRVISIRAVRTRSERIRDAVEREYARKYPTPGSAKYVRGFRSKRRRDTTTEFLPR